MYPKNHKYDKPCYIIRWKSKTSGEIELEADTIAKMAEMAGFSRGNCRSIFNGAAKHERGKGLYSIFESKESAYEFLKSGKQWPYAVKHEPTGNVWESIREACDFLHCAYNSVLHWIEQDIGFSYCHESPIIKDETLKYIRRGTEAYFSWKGHTLQQDMEEREPHYTGKYDGFVRDTEYRFYVNKVACLKKDCELSPRHKAGELLTITTVGETGIHNYRVRFSNGDIGYLRKEEFEIL
jgi:hypothetical protein